LFDAFHSQPKRPSKLRVVSFPRGCFAPLNNPLNPCQWPLYTRRIPGSVASAEVLVMPRHTSLVHSMHRIYTDAAHDAYRLSMKMDRLCPTSLSTWFVNNCYHALSSPFVVSLKVAVIDTWYCAGYCSARSFHPLPLLLNRSPPHPLRAPSHFETGYVFVRRKPTGSLPLEPARRVNVAQFLAGMGYLPAFQFVR
jgi:hypothetical protein